MSEMTEAELQAQEHREALAALEVALENARAAIIEMLEPVFEGAIGAGVAARHGLVEWAKAAQ